MQQSRYNDIQLLQQQLMLKQLQEMQRQQQIPQLCDVRQQSSINYPFAASKQGAEDIPQSLFINGTYLADTSQLLTNWDNRDASPFVQGLPNRLSPSVDQGQALDFTGFHPQSVGASIYGSPVPSARDNESHSSNLRGISPETANLANKNTGYYQPLSVLQSSALSNSFMRDQLAASSDQVCISEASYMGKQDYISQSTFGEFPPQNHSNELLPGTLLPENANLTSTLVQVSNWKPDQADWPGNMDQKPAQMIPLDPLEKKILYNSDDSAWDASFGNYSDIVPGGCGDTCEPMDTFPSLHSGSWSALMQSAVAETSSGDTGLTEEWSGLTSQNPETSTENQPSVIESGRQHTGWADKNLQNPFSFTSSPIPAFSNSSMSPSIPAFQPSNVQASYNQHVGLHQDVPHRATQKPVTNAIEWLDRYSMQQKSLLQGKQQLQPPSHLNAWSGNNYECTGGDKISQTMPFYDYSGRLLSQGKGENNGALYQVPNASVALGNANSVNTVDSWRLTGGLDQLHSAASVFTLKREDLKANNFVAVQTLGTERSQQGANQYIQAHNQPNAMSQVGNPINDKVKMSIERDKNQITSVTVLHHPFKAANGPEPVENVKEKSAVAELEHLNASDISTNLAKEGAICEGNLKESEGIASGVYPQSNIPAGSHGVDFTPLRSVAEKEWAQATNRLIEKLEGELDKVKEKSPKLRAKRRLLLSTHLVQQLLHAPPASTLSVDAVSTYDSLTYFVAKDTIRDACSLTNYRKSDSPMLSNCRDRIQEKVGTFERSGNSYFSKVVQDFTSRAKVLENALTRLETALPFLDIQVENQELERYSVINRFAKFHIRGQPNYSKTSPGSGAPPTVQRASPQKHITSHLLTETPPEVVKCLSL